MAKVLFVVSGATYLVLNDGTRWATGYWAEEFARPYQAITNAGHEVVVATPNGVTPTVDMMSLRPSMTDSEKESLDLEDIIRSAEAMRRPIQVADARLEDYDAVYLPGGHGPLQDLAVEEAVGLASRCQWLLEDELKDKVGVEYSKGEMWKPYTLADRNLFTGQNPDSAAVLAERLLKELEAA
jgi:putative intracellular protease/amidase